MELGQCLFLVLGMVCPGASPPPSTAGALSTREGGWGPGGGASRAHGLPLSWVKTASQARLTFPRGNRASHPSPVPAQHGAAPWGRRPALRGCPALARSPLGVSPRAGSPTPCTKEGQVLTSYLESCSSLVPGPRLPILWPSPALERPPNSCPQLVGPAGVGRG